LLAILSFITHAQNTSSEIFEDTTEIQTDIAPQITENTPTPEQEVIISDEDQLLNYFAENYGSEESNLNFRFDHLSVKNDWACAMVTPLKDGAEYGEPRWNLFNKVNGIWNVVYWSEGVTFENDFELIDLPMQNSRIANLIVEKYPQCPMEIFGVSNNQ
jgi:hypothetical protein